MANPSWRFKIVLVPFPFDDLSSTKVRPAVCLTDAIGPHQHVVLAFITSRTLESDIHLAASSSAHSHYLLSAQRVGRTAN